MSISFNISPLHFDLLWKEYSHSDEDDASNANVRRHYLCKETQTVQSVCLLLDTLSALDTQAASLLFHRLGIAGKKDYLSLESPTDDTAAPKKKKKKKKMKNTKKTTEQDPVVLLPEAPTIEVVTSLLHLMLQRRTHSSLATTADRFYREVREREREMIESMAERERLKEYAAASGERIHRERDTNVSLAELIGVTRDAPTAKDEEDSESEETSTASLDSLMDDGENSRQVEVEEGGESEQTEREREEEEEEEESRKKKKKKKKKSLVDTVISLNAQGLMQGAYMHNRVQLDAQHADISRQQLMRIASLLTPSAHTDVLNSLIRFLAVYINTSSFALDACGAYSIHTALSSALVWIPHKSLSCALLVIFAVLFRATLCQANLAGYPVMNFFISPQPSSDGQSAHTQLMPSLSDIMHRSVINTESPGFSLFAADNRPLMHLHAMGSIDQLSLLTEHPNKEIRTLASYIDVCFLRHIGGASYYQNTREPMALDADAAADESTWSLKGGPVDKQIGGVFVGGLIGDSTEGHEDEEEGRESRETIGFIPTGTPLSVPPSYNLMRVQEEATGEDIDLIGDGVTNDEEEGDDNDETQSDGDMHTAEG